MNLQRLWPWNAAVLALGLWPPLALAQTDAPKPEGTLSAVSCTLLPAAPHVAVEAQEDSQEFRRLKEKFVAGLKAHGVTIGDSAPLRASLYVEAAREDNALLSARSPHPVRQINPASRQAFFEIWSNQRNSILGGNRPRTRSVDEVHVSILIHDVSNGRCVWQGEAIHAIGGRDELEIAEQLTQALGHHIGATVKAPLVGRQ